MSTTFERRLLTGLLKTTLQAVQVNGANQLVEVGSMPLGAGWGTGEPNAAASHFVPYAVITTSTATPSADTGSLSDPQGDWHVPYLIQSFGVRHDQAEWLADKNRPALEALKGEVITLGTNRYKVQQVWTSSIGGVNRVPATNPPYFAQSDGVTIWIAKRRT